MHRFGKPWMNDASIQGRITDASVESIQCLNRSGTLVRAIRPQGILELEGADGQTARGRMELCAPCHIPNLVTNDVGVPADLACTVCGSASMADPMILCDRCDRGYHMHCLNPPLERVPAGVWTCPRCQQQPAVTVQPLSLPPAL